MLTERGVVLASGHGFPRLRPPKRTGNARMLLSS